MPRLTQELQFPNETENPRAPYNGVAVFCKNGSLYTIDSNGIVALIGSGNSETVDLSNYYTINETDNAISTAINALINGAPGTLDTLKELADAVNSNKSLVDALNEAISNKQDKLVSGTNIKTINGKSILGSGDITISSSGTNNAIPITGSSELSGTFAPSVDAGADLGTRTKRFSDIYAHTLGDGSSPIESADINTIYVLKSIIPPISKRGIAIGDSSRWFGSIYLGDSESAKSGKLVPPTSSMSEPRTWTLPNASGTIALTTDLNGKQDTLVSGTNIKTINGNSLTGSGNITVNELKGFVSYDDERLGTANYAYFAIQPRELPTYDKERYEAHIGPLNDVSFIRGKLINMNDGTEFDRNYTKEAGNNYWILDIPKKSGTLATLEDIQSSGSGIDDSTISTSSTYSSSKIDSTYLKAPDGRLDIENGRVNLKNNINSVYSITNNEVVMELNDDGLRYHDNATNLDVNITPYYGATDQSVDPATIKVNGIGLARETDLNKKVSLRGDTMTGNLNAPAFTVDSTKVAAGDKPLIDGAINFKYKNTNDEASNAWLTMLPSGQLQFGSQGAVASETGTVATQEWVNKKITNAYIYKGSVDTYDALPSSADPGFVYNVRSNGANYAWTGTEWDELGATVNLDIYALKTDLPQNPILSGTTSTQTINSPLTISGTLEVDVAANNTTNHLKLKDTTDGNIVNVRVEKKADIKNNIFNLTLPLKTGTLATLDDIPSLTGYATESWVESKNYLTTHQSLDSKQDKLVSGTNIKTINGTSILGAGNITISGGSSGSGSGIQIYEQMPAPEEVSDGQIIAMPTNPNVVDVVYNANTSSWSDGVSMTSGNTRTYNSTIGAKNYWMITYTYGGYYTNTLIVPCTGTNFYGFHTGSTSAYLRCSSTTDGKTLTLYNAGETIYIHAVMAF